MVVKKFCVHLILVTVLFLSACTREDSVYHEQILAFGTLIDVKIWGVSEQTGRQAVALITEDFNYMHKAWHAWQPSALSRVNQLLPSGEVFTISPSLLPLIKLAKDLSQRSGGRFNPAIGKLIKLWGFASDTPPSGPPPTQQAIDALLAKHPSMNDVILDGIKLHSTNDGVSLDFGGFAKGYGVDVAIDHLKELGIKNAVINAGGDLRAIGRHGDRPWRVGIRDPRGAGILAAVDVEGDECELNHKLADSGYNVYIEARDSYSKTLSIIEIRQHDDWVVAYKCNGMLINQTDHNWPLKLVGPGLIDAFRIGGIVKIRLLLP